MAGHQDRAGHLGQDGPDPIDEGQDGRGEGRLGGGEERRAQDEGLALGSVGDHHAAGRDVIAELGFKTERGGVLLGHWRRSRARSVREVREAPVETGEGQVDRVRVPAEGKGEGGEEPEQQEPGHGGQDPQRDLLNQRVTLGCHPLPMGREVSFRVAALGTDDLVQIGTHPFELVPAALAHPVAALEPLGQTEVNQFQEVQVARRVGEQAVQCIEELLPAPGLVVETGQESLVVPDTLTAPGGIQDGFVHQCAQDIAGGQDDRIRQAAGARAGFEVTHLAHEAFAQPTRVPVREAAAQLTGDGQQVIGAGHQRVVGGDRLDDWRGDRRAEGWGR